MTKNNITLLGTAIATASAADAAADQTALDQAFVALTSYDLGSSRAALLPIDEAVVASLNNAAARKALEQRLLTPFKSKLSVAAKEYVCRKLGLIGSSAAVATLAPLLTDPELAHAARSALETMPDLEAAKALRDSVPHAKGPFKIGLLNSLGARRDVGSVPALTALLDDADAPVAGAAAAALGNIGTVEAARALQKFSSKAPESIRLAVADACLACAERLSADGKKAEALLLYESLERSSQPSHVQLAAKLGRSRIEQ